jgi:hypothetical protein
MLGARGGRRLRLGVGRRPRFDRLGFQRRRPHSRVLARDAAHVRVAVGVPVRVAQHDVGAQLGAVPAADDLGVVGGDDRRRRRRLNHQLAMVLVGAVAPAHRAADGDAALGQRRQRRHQVVRERADEFGPQHHRVDVPPRVVVGEDRLAEVALRPGGLQVPGRGEDGVGGVVRVLAAVPVGVHAVGAPGGRHELHPALRPGGRDREVAPVVGLDLVDRRQHLPRHAVLDPGGLVDRQQERRDREAVEQDVGDRCAGGARRHR